MRRVQGTCRNAAENSLLMTTTNHIFARPCKAKLVFFFLLLAFTLVLVGLDLNSCKGRRVVVGGREEGKRRRRSNEINDDYAIRARGLNKSEYYPSRMAKRMMILLLQAAQHTCTLTVGIKNIVTGQPYATLCWCKSKYPW